MVSFFGLKFGGDKKKTGQSKHLEKKQSPQPQPQPQLQSPQGHQSELSRMDQMILGEGPYFSHNFSRPQRPLSRPGTANSMAPRNTNWRAVFSEAPAASSMVDLSASARRPSFGSQHEPGTEGATRGAQPWMKSNASTTSLVMPDPFGTKTGVRPGTPSRPYGAKNSEWVNPLDVHFGKDPASSTRPGTPAGVSPAEIKSQLSQFDFGVREQDAHDDDATDFGEPGPDVGVGGSGYPSPPHSIDATDHKPPISMAPFERQNPANTLGPANKFGPTSLPSPSPSASGASEDRWDPPIIRNVHAKRDTYTFSSPRRRSFAMAIEEADLEKHRKQQRPVEGLAGNFSDFDFGDTVAKPASKAASPELHVESKAKPASNIVSLGLELVESPIEMKEPHPFKAVDSSRSLTEPKAIPSVEPPKVFDDKRVFVPTLGQPHPSPKRPLPGLPAKALTSPAKLVADATPIESPKQLDLKPPPTAVPAASPTSASAFDRTPQGFNSRLGSDSRSRGPPRPLRAAPLSGLAPQVDAVAPSPRSPYGPPASDSNYLRTEDAPRPPMDRGLPSPFASRPPMEGSFPVSKGLPRGRQPYRPQGGYDGQAQDQANGHTIWGLEFDRTETRHSAMPAPLSPAIRQQPPVSPSWSISTSATAPRIPSPTFPSLEKAISSTSQELARSFEMAYDIPHPQPSPLATEFSFNDLGSSMTKGSPRRVEAKKAPPRPAPITLPPSYHKDKGPMTPDSVRSPHIPNLEVRTTFI